MKAETADITVRSVSVTNDEWSVGLMDGRSISMPLAWYPRWPTQQPRSARNGKSQAVVMAFIGRRPTRI